MRALWCCNFHGQPILIRRATQCRQHCDKACRCSWSNSEVIYLSNSSSVFPRTAVQSSKFHLLSQSVSEKGVRFTDSFGPYLRHVGVVRLGAHGHIYPKFQSDFYLQGSLLNHFVDFARHTITMLDSKSDARAGVQNAATGPTEIAPRPFDRADADVILRSSDHIDFHVHRAKLSIASSFFNAMFSLPQTSDTHLDVQVVDVTEDSSTMNAILRMCYPVVDRSISSFAVLSSALRAALKYDMELAVELCKQSLRLWVHSQPLQVYAVACRVEDESIARLAAVKLFDSRGTILN